MDEPVISRASIQEKARADHARGVGRDGHGFNWHALACVAVWQAEWDKCEAERLAGSNPP